MSNGSTDASDEKWISVWQFAALGNILVTTWYDRSYLLKNMMLFLALTDCSSHVFQYTWLLLHAHAGKHADTTPVDVHSLCTCTLACLHAHFVQ